MNRIAQIASAIVVNAMLAGSVNAADALVTDWGTLVALQAGWTIDRMLVFHSAPMKDPGCPITTNGYIVAESGTGHTLFNTLLLSALLARREVQFVILDCLEKRPQIVSVSIR
jgi:hypothetical protein